MGCFFSVAVEGTWGTEKYGPFSSILALFGDLGEVKNSALFPEFDPCLGIFGPIMPSQPDPPEEG